jgi:hypothetical protein
MMGKGDGADDIDDMRVANRGGGLVNKRPSIRLWIFNHRVRGISDQVDFFVQAMRMNGYQVTVSNRPAENSLNIVIESFDYDSFMRVADFCQMRNKRVAIIATEHMDFVGGDLFFHGRVLDGTYDDYMHPASKRTRLRYLAVLTEHASAFLRLGDLPELLGIKRMFPGMAVYSIPFPTLIARDRGVGTRRHLGPQYDFSFCGNMTDYRQKILRDIGRHYRVVVIDSQMSRRVRDGANASSRLVLNIPQRADWKWISTMRVWAALRCERATVSIIDSGSDSERGLIARASVNISAKDVDGDYLRAVVSSSERVYEQMLGYYLNLAGEPMNLPFPVAFFELWAEMEL